MSEEVSMESFRRFVHVELPFLVHTNEVRNGVPVGDPRVRAHQRNDIAHFLPPNDCATFLHNGTQEPASDAGEDGAPLQRKRRRRKRRGSGEDEDADGDDGSSGASSSASSASLSSPLSGEDEEEEGSSSRRQRKRAREKEKATETPDPMEAFVDALDVWQKEKYSNAPVAHCWRGTDWARATPQPPLASSSSGSSHHHHGDEGPMERARRSDAEIAALEKERRRRVAFPSTVPRLLLKGYCRNDLLLQITERRRVRRWRNVETGEIVDYLPATAPTREESEAEPTATVTDVKVLGVVSREVELSRPADFAFALWQQQQQQQELESQGADAGRPRLPPGGVADATLFPPRVFTPHRALDVFHYAIGREPNESLLRYVEQHPDLVPHSCAARLLTTLRATTARPNSELDDAAAPAAVLSVDAVLPPPRRPAQLDFLEFIGSSATGDLPTDPAAVRTIAALFAARPLWQMKHLVETAQETGQCPPGSTMRRMIAALSYTMEGGPYGSLRVRHDYNPFEQKDLLEMVLCQRHTVRLMRRSPMGVLVRDLSRSPHLPRVTRILLLRAKRQEEQEAQQQQQQQQQQAQAEQTSEPAPRSYADRYASLFYNPVAQTNLFCQLVQNGSLYFRFQLFELGRHDAVLHRVLAEVEARYGGNAPASKVVKTEGEEESGGPSPCFVLPHSQRASYEGWLSAEQYVRLREHMRELLYRFLTEDVTPLLQQFAARKDSGGGEEEATSRTAVSAAAQREGGSEEGEDDSHFSYSGDDEPDDNEDASSSDGE